MKMNLFLLLILISLHSMGQSDSGLKSHAVTGQWIQCISTKLNKEVDCSNGKCTIEFKIDSTYTETRKLEDNRLIVTTGHWFLDGEMLTTDPADTKSHVSYPRVRKIKWITSDLFYYRGREGKHGPWIYTYFQRVIE